MAMNRNAIAITAHKFIPRLVNTPRLESGSVSERETKARIVRLIIQPAKANVRV